MRAVGGSRDHQESVLPDMERTLVRVALLCCWLDWDSSLAGASLVSRVCSDGSDL